MKIKLGIIAKVVYQLILGFFIFFSWRVLHIEQIVNPMDLNGLIIGGIMLFAPIVFLFFLDYLLLIQVKTKLNTFHYLRFLLEHQA